jgi:hypothetical protein
MESDLPAIIERELTKSGKKELVEIADGFFTVDSSTFERVNAIYIYDSRNKIHDVICSLEEAEQLRTHLEWAFSKGMFNVIYLEPNNSPRFAHVLARIRSPGDLGYYFGIIKTELEEGRYPVKYSISKVLNTESSAKWRGLI